MNIGRGGVTTHAGISGTGVSYRRKLGGRHGWIGMLVLLAGLGVWAWQNRDDVAATIASHLDQAAQTAPANIAPPEHHQN